MPTKKKHPVRDLVPAKSMPSPAALDGQAQKQQPARKPNKKRDDQDRFSMDAVEREIQHLDGRLSAVAEESAILHDQEQKVRAPAVMPPTTARECPVHSRPSPHPMTTKPESQTPVALSDTESDSGNSETWAAEDDERQLATLKHYLTDIFTFTIRERKQLGTTLLAQSLRRSPYHPTQPFTRTRAYFLNWVVTHQPHLSFSATRQAYTFLCKHVFRCKPIPATICGPAIDERRNWCFRREGEKGKRVRGARFEGFWGIGGDDGEVVVLSFGAWDWKGERLGSAFLRAWFGERERARMLRCVGLASRGVTEASEDEGAGGRDKGGMHENDA
ncbi:hypothetical protein EJ03DRAFT_354052 [Teratosphaeria nubilosa]|uniref:Uncharacterized protein n=1 Tax=Teratosphaeria nubilosa TaxID=161662 RepID=A0A6G1L0B9_9PEZI|nr:hypothetical protein EJ03DRAFT_354052 [Teratosphaeria nubilosa]